MVQLPILKNHWLPLILPHRAMGAWAIAELGKGRTPGKHTYPLTKMDCNLVERDSSSAPG